MDAILKLHDQIQDSKLGAHRRAQVADEEAAALEATPTIEMKGLLR
jgi:NADH-quinone oxidoreductase subunit B